MNLPTVQEWLKPPQLCALEVLLSGGSVGEAAASGGVGLATVRRWLKADHSFRAALNAGRQELHASYRARLERLVGKAINAVEQAVDGGNVKAAMAVLSGLGFLDGQRPEIGSTRPATLEREHVKEVASELRADQWASDDYDMIHRLEAAAGLVEPGPEE